MHACLRAGAWDEALSVWSELRARPDRPRPCARTYATALRACGALGLWTAALELLSEMTAAGGDLSPEARHYAFAVSAAAVADDRASDEDTALSGRGWGDGGEGRVGGDEEGAEGGGAGGELGDGGGDTALRVVLSEMAAGGARLGWEAYAAVCWARSQQKHWHRASLGVLELIGECGLEEDASAPAIDQQQQQQRAEGMRSLYGRLLTAAGKIPGCVGEEPRKGAAAHAVRQILADAEERLAALPGGPGPHVIAAAAVGFARAGDWESARDVALRFSPSSRDEEEEDHAADIDVAGAGAGSGGGGNGELLSSSSSAFRRGAADATSATASAAGAAIAACARAGELEEAEALAEELGFGQEAGLALATAYERAGRPYDAEALRSRLQGRAAISLGLDEADGVEGRSSGSGQDDDAGRQEEQPERVDVPAGLLPNVGGPSGLMASALDDGRTGLDDGLGGGADHQYDLFLQWMATGEEDEEEVEDADAGVDAGAGAGGAWSGDELWGPAAEDGGMVGSRAGAPVERGSEEGLTIRELEGW